MSLYVGSAQLRLVKRKQTKVLMTRMCRQNMPTEDGERRRIEDEERTQGRAEKERERETRSETLPTNCRRRRRRSCAKRMAIAGTSR